MEAGGYAGIHHAAHFSKGLKCPVIQSNQEKNTALSTGHSEEDLRGIWISKTSRGISDAWVWADTPFCTQSISGIQEGEDYSGLPIRG